MLVLKLQFSANSAILVSLSKSYIYTTPLYSESYLKKSNFAGTVGKHNPYISFYH
jgi:hypothetical protein